MYTQVAMYAQITTAGEPETCGHEAAATAAAESDDLATEAALTGSFDHHNVV